LPAFKYRILYVDDEASVRATASAVLQSAGYEVLTAEDGLDALHCLTGALPELIITDLRMPRMSGFELLAVVRNRFPQIPTIAISGEYVPERLPDALLADAFLPKGQYDVSELFHKIEELLSKPPARPFPGTRNISTIWVALRGTRELVITCPQCLRSCNVEADQVTMGLHKAECDFCQNKFEYNVDEHNMETLMGSKSSKYEKRKAQSAPKK
jgi:CheY-like chemotaxis protein